MLDTRVVPIGQLGRMKGSHVRVMLILYRFADGAGICWPSYRTIMRETEMCLGAVKRAITEMAALEYLQIERRTGDHGGAKSNLYRIAARLLPKRHAPPVQERVQGGLTEAPEGELEKGQLLKTESVRRPEAEKISDPIPDARVARLDDAVRTALKKGKPAPDQRWLRARRKEQWRQKVMRFVNACWGAAAADAWWKIVLGDDAEAQRLAFERASRDMEARGWNDKREAAR